MSDVIIAGLFIALVGALIAGSVANHRAHERCEADAYLGQPVKHKYMPDITGFVFDTWTGDHVRRPGCKAVLRTSSGLIIVVDPFEIEPMKP